MEEEVKREEGEEMNAEALPFSELISKDLRDWFKALYEVLLGQSQGPRFGSFVALFGLVESINLIKRVLENKVAAEK